MTQRTAKHPLRALKRTMTRDQQIIICYRAGNTITEIAAAFEITKQRVDQILKNAGVSKNDNPKTRNQHLYAFIGANVPIDVKEEIVAEVKRRKQSISSYLLHLIKEDLAL